MHKKYGFVRVAAASCRVQIGNPEANATEIISVTQKMADCDIVLHQELGLTAYSCRALFGQGLMIRAAQAEVLRIAKAVPKQVVVVGCPVPVGDVLYNCGVILNEGGIVGVVPKTYMPMYREFEELRWFKGAAPGLPSSIEWPHYGVVPFGTDLIFELEGGPTIGVEVCEDIWVPIPPSCLQALAGATILLNLSASNETVTKADYRRNLVTGQSGRCIAAVAYASCGEGESSTDVVFGGHCLIAENGNLSVESRRVGDGHKVVRGSHAISADIDYHKLNGERKSTTSFADFSMRTGFTPTFRRISVVSQVAWDNRLIRKVDGQPFVPKNEATLNARCAEIFGIQVAGMIQRFDHVKPKHPMIGISGGLDSTLALLVAVKTYQALGWDLKGLTGITLPGFGTSTRTLNNALKLMEGLGITSKTQDIRKTCLETWREMDHKAFGVVDPKLSLLQFVNELKNVPPDADDLVFENTQARVRTNFLFNQGFTIGTGDLSEAALGWCTYGGDHISMYNPNCSIPKTLVKFLVKWAAENEFEGEVQQTLLDIVGTEISPELKPSVEGQANTQSTESSVGPYELHDFFLYHFLRSGYSPEKIQFMSQFATFDHKYSPQKIADTLTIFVSRFFNNQFKRSCVPDGPKVGISLSPRGDWKMPSDADATFWLKSILKFTGE